ncbi:hypothetical protein L547_3832 [Bordetella pertussis H918]|nr:hypothetical protein L547_3832 [Bordetella pertussis H918]
MNTHKHARLTFLRRLEMVQQLIAHQVCVPEAARCDRPARARTRLTVLADTPSAWRCALGSAACGAAPR